MDEISMEGQHAHQPPENNLALTPLAQQYIGFSARLAGYLGIFGFVMSGLILLVAVGSNIFVSIFSYDQRGPDAARVAGLGLGVMAIVYFIPSLFLFQFSKGVKRGLVFADNHQLETGLNKLKNYFICWAVMSVLTVFVGMFTTFGR